MAVTLRSVVAGSVYGLGTALAFSVSPIFVRMGMADGHSAIVGLAVGLVAAALAYGGIALISDPGALDLRRLERLRPISWELAAALVIVTGTWMRYVAMGLVPLAIVSAVGRVNILVILLLAGRSVSPRVWAGGALIIAGTVLLSI
jgi:drug/metabolite transporter (DMT)-like permease